jgi:hypothetical protein
MRGVIWVPVLCSTTVIAQLSTQVNLTPELPSKEQAAGSQKTAPETTGSNRSKGNPNLPPSENETDVFIPFTRIPIGGWIGSFLLGGLMLLIALTIVWRGRNYEGYPNTVRCEIIEVTGLPDRITPYVSVSVLGELMHRTDFLVPTGRLCTFNESFRWSVSYRDMRRFRSEGLIKFELCDMKGEDYDISDRPILQVPIPVRDLYVEGQVERMEPLSLTRGGGASNGVVMRVRLGIFSEHYFYQSLNRFIQSWRLRRTEISFWTFFISIPISIILVVCGVGALPYPSRRVCGISDIVTGSLFLFLLLPHLLHWVGSTFLDKIRLEGLLSWASLCASTASTLVTVYKWVGPAEPVDVWYHFVGITWTALSVVLFVLSELRNEPGASCIGSTVGEALRSCLSCCCFRRSKLARVAAHAL